MKVKNTLYENYRQLHFTNPDYLGTVFGVRCDNGKCKVDDSLSVDNGSSTYLTLKPFVSQMFLDCLNFQNNFDEK